MQGQSWAAADQPNLYAFVEWSRFRKKKKEVNIIIVSPFSFAKDLICFFNSSLSSSSLSIYQNVTEWWLKLIIRDQPIRQMNEHHFYISE